MSGSGFWFHRIQIGSFTTYIIGLGAFECHCCLSESVIKYLSFAKHASPLSTIRMVNSVIDDSSRIYRWSGLLGTAQRQANEPFHIRNAVSILRFYQLDYAKFVCKSNPFFVEYAVLYCTLIVNVISAIVYHVIISLSVHFRFVDHRHD